MLDFVALSLTEKAILREAATSGTGCAELGGLPDRDTLARQNAALNLIVMGLATFVAPRSLIAPHRWGVRITRRGRDVLKDREARNAQAQV